VRYPTLRIVEYRHSATAKYVIEGVRVNGKRKRLFFATEGAAEKELARIKTKQRKEGENALKLPDALRIMALESAEKLKPFGRTILDATEFYVKFLRDAERSISLSNLVEEYLAAQKRLKRSQAHITDLKQRLGRFKEDFGERPIRTVTTVEIERWLHRLKLSPQSINNFRARLGALFSYAEKRSYVEKNPISAIDKIKLVDAPPQILTPEQLQKALETCPADLLPCIALGAFAGLRTAELLRLEWEDIDMKRGFINVAASKSKSAKRRLIPITPNLADWLRPYSQNKGKLYPYSHRWYHLNVDLLKKPAGLAKWPNNGLRHSFASYHLAKYQNAPQLALEMGHTTPRMIFDNYREVVTPEEAQRYWNVVPASRPANLIAMKSVAPA
jgi:integrase